MKKVGIGIVGFGTVGAGVAEGLIANADLLARRCGTCAELRAVADLDITTDRGVDVPAALLTTDSMGLVKRPDIDVVVELIGGCGVAYDIVRTALENGKSVVTANKKLLAEKGEELYALARERGADLYFGASVGGGIPIVRSLRDGLVANEITKTLVSDSEAILRMKYDGELFFSINVMEESSVASQLMGDVKLPSGSRVACILRGDRRIFPRMDVQYLPGDKVLMFTYNVKISKLEKLFRSQINHGVTDAQ